MVFAFGKSITNFNFIFKGDFYYEKIYFSIVYGWNFTGKWNIYSPGGRSTGDYHLVAYSDLQKLKRHYGRGLPMNIWQLIRMLPSRLQAYENENFKTKMTTVMLSGEPPDIFQSWGGGVMNEYAKAGLLKDITADLDKDGWRDTFAPGALGVYSYRGKKLRCPA